MMKFGIKFWDWVKNKPLLTGLIILLIVITVMSIKPGFYLMGWDNYSSYLNLNQSIFRTLFATWREYRGVGVPSDAEVTDVFRLIFDWIIRWVVPEGWLDQIYYMVALWLGVLGTYLLGVKIGKNFVAKDWSRRGLDLLGGLSGFLYLFNLNTLSVFYSPIIPFTNRYYGLPLVLWAVLNHEEKQSKKSLLVLMLIVVITSGSFITPTVVITTLLALGIFWLFNLNIKKTIAYGALFLALNAFWMLPFVNYSKEKSALVPLARTFVEINESTLNRPADTFDWTKQALMYPSFLDINFPTINKVEANLHPDLDNFQSQTGQLWLMLFVVFYVLGSGLIVIGWKKYIKMLWVPLWILVFLFLSMKEYGPGGSAYIWLKDHIPYFGIIFRISDTKFHAYINLAGSLAGGLMLSSLIVKLGKIKYLKFAAALVVLVLVGYAVNFRSYFNGNMLGFYVYTVMPQAYKEIAKVVNSDKSSGKLLHLPMSNQHHYWRSFDWGYIGSAFFNFMIDRPYVDMTFEPASMENVFVDSRITQLLDNQYLTDGEASKRSEAEKFLKLMNQMGVSYIMVDNSIGSEVDVRNLVYTSKQYVARSESMLKRLESMGLVERVGGYKINLNEMLESYKKIYPVTKTGLPDGTFGDEEVILYKVKQAKSIFEFVPAAVEIDSYLDNLAETDLESSEMLMRQNKEVAGIVEPMSRQNHEVEIGENQISLNYSVMAGKYVVTTGDGDAAVVEVQGNMKGNNLELDFYDRYLPNINGIEYRKKAGSVEFKNIKLSEIGDYSLEIEGMEVNLEGVNENNQTLALLLLHGVDQNVRLYKKEMSEVVGWDDFSETVPLNCYGPGLNGFEGKISEVGGKLELVASNGSACSKSLVASGSERIKIKMKASAEVISKEMPSGLLGKAMDGIGTVVPEGYWCVKSSGEVNCSNKMRQIKLGSDEREYGSGWLDNSLGQAEITVGVVASGGNKFKERIGEVEVEGFDLVSEEKVSLDRELVKLEIDLKDNFTIGIPNFENSKGNTISENGWWSMPLEQCRGGENRLQRDIDGVTVNLMNNCSVYMALPFDYTGKYPYLLAYSYWLGSGQQPVLVMGKEGDDYLVERASLLQGYPGIVEKTLADPEDKKTIGQIESKLENIELIGASRLLTSDAKLNKSEVEANIHIFQDSDNEAVMGLKDLKIMEYPQSWKELRLTPVAGAEQDFELPNNFEFRQILPSVWLLNMAEINSKALLLFRQGYDRQWGVYKNLGDLILNKTAAVNSRCDGINNCFEINQGGKYIVAYWPEVLSMAGWTITLGTVFFGLIWWKRSKKTEDK